MPRNSNYFSQDYEENPRPTPVNTNAAKHSLVKLILFGIFGVVMTIVACSTLMWGVIKGNEYGVLETQAGVSTNVIPPGLYWYFPGWFKEVYHYDMSSQVFVMNNKKGSHGETGKGRENDSYKVQSIEGQDMTIAMNLRWRRSPEKLVEQHKTVRDDIEEKLIRPKMMRVAKDEATKLKAIDAYSGPGLVALQASIQKDLMDPAGELAQRGIIVENFVIEDIQLDPKYIEEIKGKQIATQKALRAKEEQTAAEAEALVAKSKAQADFNTKLVAQQLLATNMVLQAQAENEKMVIAAEAEAKKQMLAAEASSKTQVLEAEGKKGAMLATAEGTLAMGKAEAQAKELMLKAWAVPGADAFVKVEVSKSLGTAFSNIKGYLPSDMKVNLLTDNFKQAVDSLTGNPVVQPKP